MAKMIRSFLDGNAIDELEVSITTPDGDSAMDETNNSVNVTVVSGLAAIGVIGGGTEAAALRVTIANNSTGVLSVDDNAGSLTVDNAVLSVTGGGTEASAMRVTIANNSTGVLSVDDNAGSLTVDNSVLSVVGGGTEAAAQRVTIANDSTGVITVDGTVTVTHPQLGGGTESGAQRVTIASDSTGVLSVDDNGGALTVDGTVTADIVTTGLVDGRQTVPTPGTGVALASTTAIKWVAVTAETDNTSTVALGNSITSVEATAGAQQGVVLHPGDSTVIEINDIASVFVDADVADEGVSFLYGT